MPLLPMLAQRIQALDAAVAGLTRRIEGLAEATNGYWTSVTDQLHEVSVARGSDQDEVSEADTRQMVAEIADAVERIEVVLAQLSLDDAAEEWDEDGEALDGEDLDEEGFEDEAEESEDEWDEEGWAPEPMVAAAELAERFDELDAAVATNTARSEELLEAVQALASAAPVAATAAPMAAMAGVADEEVLEALHNSVSRTDEVLEAVGAHSARTEAVLDALAESTSRTDEVLEAVHAGSARHDELLEAVHAGTAHHDEVVGSFNDAVRTLRSELRSVKAAVSAAGGQDSTAEVDLAGELAALRAEFVSLRKRIGVRLRPDTDDPRLMAVAEAAAQQVAGSVQMTQAQLQFIADAVAKRLEQTFEVVSDDEPEPAPEPPLAEKRGRGRKSSGRVNARG